MAYDKVGTAAYENSSSFATAGQGTRADASPQIIANVNLTGQTGAVTSIATAADTLTRTWQVSAYLTITAISAGTLDLQAVYKDEVGNTVTQSLIPVGGATLTTTGAFIFPTVNVRVASSIVSGSVVVKTTFAGTSVAYDVGVIITQFP